MGEGAAPLARFGRYLALAELGAGAMGRVWRAHDPLIDRIVALKTIRADLLEPQDRPEFLERFRTEVRAAGRCAHPSIIAVYDFADDADPPYIVMEYVEGRPLSALLRGPERDAAGPMLSQVMLQVLEGLGAAHALGIVHRDIKPGNIMVTPRGQAKIADFGIARLGLSALTAAGGMIGTPSYMAPEQARGQAVDQRADLFSVAAVLYQIVLGRAPFAGSTLTETLLRLSAPEPADLGAAAGTPIGGVLARGLAKDPAQRFATAAEFAAALRGALSGAAPAEDATRVLASAAARPAEALDPALVGRLRADLAERLGPLATTLVRRASAGAGSGEELLRACAALLDTEEERSAFLRRHAGAPATASGRPATGHPSTLAPAAPGFELSPAARAAATGALAYAVGPLAKILVQKAAGQAGDARDFIERLCAHATPEEVPALRRKLELLF